LHAALVPLGGGLESRVARDVGAEVAPRWRRARFWPGVVGAAAVLAVGIAFAVPPARRAILKFFHIGSVSVEQVQTLPPAQTRPFSTGLGPKRPQPTVQLPARLTATAYYARPGLHAALLRYRGKQVLYAELRGDQMGFAKKFVGPTAHIEEARLGEFGMFLSGAPHVLMWEQGNVQTRLAGDVLIWVDRGGTYRPEGGLGTGQKR